jgi:ATP/maltotriose-dependent transcriptional regulator MalT
MSNKEISEKIFISPETVKRHTINIYQKLSVNSRRQTVDRARDLGICDGKTSRGRDWETISFKRKP